MRHLSSRSTIALLCGLTSLLYCHVGCGKAEKKPTAFGTYLVANGDLNELRAVPVFQAGIIGEAVSVVRELPSMTVKDSLLYFVCFSDDLKGRIQQYSLSTLRFEVGKSFRTPFGTSSYQRINGWVCDAQQELRVEPMNDQLTMFKLIPRNPLTPGLYVFHSGDICSPGLGMSRSPAYAFLVRGSDAKSTGSGFVSLVSTQDKDAFITAANSFVAEIEGGHAISLYGFPTFFDMNAPVNTDPEPYCFIALSFSQSLSRGLRAASPDTFNLKLLRRSREISIPKYDYAVVGNKEIGEKGIAVFIRSSSAADCPEGSATEFVLLELARGATLLVSQGQGNSRGTGSTVAKYYVAILPNASVREGTIEAPGQEAFVSYIENSPCLAVDGASWYEKLTPETVTEWSSRLSSNH